MNKRLLLMLPALGFVFVSGVVTATARRPSGPSSTRVFALGVAARAQTAARHARGAGAGELYVAGRE
jgi:hypothetical protein